MDWKVFQIYFDLKTIENLNLIIGKNFNQNIINKEIKDWKTHQNWGKIFKQTKLKSIETNDQKMVQIKYL